MSSQAAISKSLVHPPSVFRAHPMKMPESILSKWMKSIIVFLGNGFAIGLSTTWYNRTVERSIESFLISCSSVCEGFSTSHRRICSSRYLSFASQVRKWLMKYFFITIVRPMQQRSMWHGARREEGLVRHVWSSSPSHLACSLDMPASPHPLFNTFDVIGRLLATPHQRFESARPQEA